MGFMSGGHPSIPAIEPAPPLPKETDPGIEIKRKAEEERIRKMKGRKSTILTSAAGVTEEAEVGKKTLLGA